MRWLAAAALVLAACVDHTGPIPEGPPAYQCGDGVVDPGEACDDGVNDGRYGGCNPGCTLRSRCGDGILQRSEQCDDGSKNSDTAPSACRTSCRVAGCDDGIVAPDEACLGRTQYLFPYEDAYTDVDGDGLPDLIAQPGRTLEVRLNRAGRFETAWTATSALDGNNYGTLIDVNGDGELDLWFSTETAVEVRLGDGAGGFGPGRISALSYVPSVWLPTRDVNGDGIRDLVNTAAEDRESWENGVREGYVYLGDGEGGFRLTASFPTDVPEEWFWSPGDLDGEGRADLIRGPSVGFADQDLRWARGQGDGTFGPWAPFVTARFPTYVVEVDGDPAPEVLALSSEDGTARLLQFEGGWVQIGDSMALGPFGRRPWAVDLDGDGRSELAVLGQDRFRIISLPSGDEASSLATDAENFYVWRFGTEVPGPVLVRGGDHDVLEIGPGLELRSARRLRLDAVSRGADLDGDRLEDFFQLNHYAFGRHLDTARVVELPDHRVTQLEPAGAGFLAATEAAEIVRLEIGPTGTLAGPPEPVVPGKRFVSFDADGDGDLDLATAADRLVHLYSNDGGTFTPAEEHVLPEPVQHLTKNDQGVIVATDETVGLIDGRTVRTATIVGPWRAVAGEGRDILALNGERETLTVLRDLAVDRVLSAGADPKDLATADLDQDGRYDVSIVGEAGLTVLFGSGEVTTIPLEVEPIRVSAGDVDRDGDVDLVIVGSGASLSVAEVVINRGTELRPARPFVIRHELSAEALADVDGDGVPDFVTASFRGFLDGSGPPEIVTYFAHP